jgi:hypothetical protein
MRMMTADARYSAYFLYSYQGTNTDAVCTSKKRRKRLGLLLVEQAEALPSFLLIFFFLKKKHFGLVLRVQRALRLVTLLGPEVQMQTHLQQSASDCTPHSARAA